MSNKRNTVLDMLLHKGRCQSYYNNDNVLRISNMSFERHMSEVMVGIFMQTLNAFLFLKSTNALSFLTALRSKNMEICRKFA